MINIPDQGSMLPVRFPVMIAGVSMEATVLEDLGDIACYRYKVRFDDGTEDIFTLVEGPELFIEAGESGHQHYANALANDLYELSKIEPGLFYFVFPATIGDEPVNMWMVEEEPDPGEKDCVMVSYDKTLQFQLYLATDQDKWQVRELTRSLDPGEKKIAQELAVALETVRGAIDLQNWH